MHKFAHCSLELGLKILWSHSTTLRHAKHGIELTPVPLSLSLSLSLSFSLPSLQTARTLHP